MLTNINFGKYYERDSVVHKLSPVFKIISLLIMIVSIFFIDSYKDIIMLTSYLILMMIYSDINILTYLRNIYSIKTVSYTHLDVYKRQQKILFVVGLEHNNYKENISNVEKINDIANKHYPGLSRGIYKKEGPGVDGIYNQDISSNSILIELGGVDNNIDEVLNTTEAISNILYYYIKG